MTEPNTQTQEEGSPDFLTNTEIEETHGFKILESASAEVDNNFDSPTIDNRIAKTHMPDEAWMLSNMLERRWLVETINWSLSQSNGTILGTYMLLQDILVNSFVHTPFDRFHYFRCKSITIHMQMQSSKFHQGRVLSYYLPSQTPAAVPVSLRNAVLLQHAFIDPSTDQIVNFVVPWTLYKDFIDLESSEDVLGQFQIVVFNQLATGTTGSTQVSMKIWASIQEPEFHIPRIAEASTPRRLRATPQSGFNKFIKGVGDTVTNIAGTANKIATAFIPENISGITNLAMLLDKPQLPEQPTPVARKEQRYVSNSVGPDYVDSLTLKPNSQPIANSDTAPTTEDQMSLEFLCKKKWNYLSSISVPDTTPIGSPLFIEKVGPFSEPLLSSPSEITTDSYYAGCSGANFWSGGYKYAVQVVCTQMHETRLDLVYLPEQFSAPATYEDALTQFTTSVEVRNNNTCFLVECPFISETPVKKVHSGETTGIVPGVRYERDYWTGSFAVYLGGSIVHPDSVSPGIVVNVFKCVADDFMFHVPNMTNRSMAIDDYPTTTAVNQQPVSKPLPPANRRRLVVKPQAGEAGLCDLNCDPSQQVAIMLGTQGKASPALSGHLDDPIPSLREFLKRQIPVHTPAEDITTQTAGLASWQYFIGAADAFRPGSLFYKNALHRSLIMFRNIFGPTVVTYRAFPLLEETTGTLNSTSPFYVGYLTYATAGSDTRLTTHHMFPSIDVGLPHAEKGSMPLSFFSTQHTAEVKIPYITMSNSALLTHDMFLDPIKFANYTYRPTLMATINFPITIANYEKIYQAAVVTCGFGDETQCFNFIGLPTVYSEVEGTSSIYPDTWV